jgi:Polyketide cyclase / dehydrase and lipid transport
MILRIAIGIAVLIAGILVFAATKPNLLHIQRSILINASPDNIFALINDFHSWSGWAPQDNEDSTMTRTYRGAAYGKGAVSDWNSTGSAGKGRMTITESVPSEMISIEVDFVKPLEARNLNHFTFEPAGRSTKVTWTMNGTNLYVMKIMSVFRNMDGVIGPHLESGLVNLKTISER